MNVNPYVKTNWRDHIVDIETGQVIQEGTRFTAGRANNIEEGIFNAYEYLKAYDDEITKLRIQLEMVGRSPINNGTFFDSLDGEENTKALKLLKQNAVSQHSLEIGSTEITVDDSTVFFVGQDISIFDEENIESKKIEDIIDNKLVVTALTKPFKKGSRVVRSNTVIRDNKLSYGQWGNCSVAISEVV